MGSSAGFAAVAVERHSLLNSRHLRLNSVLQVRASDALSEAGESAAVRAQLLPASQTAMTCFAGAVDVLGRYIARCNLASALWLAHK